MTVRRKRIILYITFFVLIALGISSSVFYRISPYYAIDLQKFQQELNRKERLAINTMKELRSILAESPVDSLIKYSFHEEDITYYVFENKELVFWSDNELDISNVNSFDFTEWHYIQLPNAYCAVLSYTISNMDYVALITIKYNYPYENDKLVNHFATGFDLDKNVGLQIGDSSDKYPVYCMNGHYLFSLVAPDAPLYNEVWEYTGSFVFLLAFLCLFILYAYFPALYGKKYITIRTFLITFLSVGLFICFLLYFNIPSILFKNSIFTAFDYASNSLLSSISHLTVLTAFVFASACLFFAFVKIEKDLSVTAKVILLFSNALYFGVLYGVLYGLIFHSSIQLNILHVNNFSFIGVWAHLILFIWNFGFGLLFFKTHNYFSKNKILKYAVVGDVLFTGLLFLFYHFVFPVKWSLVIMPYILILLGYYAVYYFKKLRFNYIYLLSWSILSAFFIAWNLLALNVEKNKGKYRILAQNVYINGNVENDPIADILLEELDKQLTLDQEARRLRRDGASIEEVKEYMDKNYFRGFWEKYEVQLNRVVKHSDLYNEYMEYIAEVGYKIKDTHFYSVPTTQNAVTYMGVFLMEKAPDSVYYFMEFYPRKQYKSYSFPDLLIPATTDIHAQLNTSVAKYDNDYLTYSSGSIDYPFDAYWIPDFTEDYTSVLFEDHWHYVYQPNDETLIVVSKQHRNDISAYLLFFVYLFFIYFVISWLIIRIYRQLCDNERFRVGLFARFQYAFIFLLIVSFLAIFYFSVDFIQKRYRTQQIETLENKRNYIQKTLQDIYFFNHDLDAYNIPSLNFDLQELSYTYQTDIHVFDNNGVLIGSSQPLIFNRHLISNRMAPTPYFSENPNMEQYEHIGKLDYLAAYTDFYNGDYLQIGYIAVPLFFSQEDIREEIQNFSTVIIHIYMVIIILAVLLAIIIGQRLSAPLTMLEKKLKEMRLGQRNEKIEYNINDEIGQLVAQYNRTVDELEQSANLLAKSERESAWRSMARQVAHEINNPLTPMKLSIQQLRRRKNMNDDGFDDYFDRSTATLIEQIDNLSRIAGTFSNFARMPEAKIEYVNVTSVLLSVVNLFVNNQEKTQIKYIGTHQALYTYADSEQLIQVFNNLIKNAIQSIPKEKKGIVKINLEEQNDKLIIQVNDNGSGIPADIQDKLFVPNFTTKSKGMGLGLAISKNIIVQLGGTISFETKQGEGSTFTVIIPK